MCLRYCFTALTHCAFLLCLLSPAWKSPPPGRTPQAPKSRSALCCSVPVCSRITQSVKPDVQTSSAAVPLCIQPGHVWAWTAPPASYGTHQAGGPPRNAHLAGWAPACTAFLPWILNLTLTHSMMPVPHRRADVPPGIHTG